MLPLCDTVLVACALAPETKGLIDARRLALMKPGALLINVARAAIVDEDALYGALKSKTAASAAPRSTCGGSTPPLPSQSGGRLAARSMNCLMF
jgi:D-isomer specific 2-hydroxyacid dehydrogenase, NAD binding domain